jgi:bacterioferritin-associated ferredoxin
MIVCVCKNISEDTIKECLLNAMTMDQIIELFELGSCCGKCLPFLQHEYTDSTDDLV